MGKPVDAQAGISEELLTVKEAAEMLKVKPSFLYESSRPGNNRIPSIKVGRYRRFRWSDLLAHFQGPQKSV